MMNNMKHFEDSLHYTTVCSISVYSILLLGVERKYFREKEDKKCNNDSHHPSLIILSFRNRKSAKHHLSRRCQYCTYRHYKFPLAA